MDKVIKRLKGFAIGIKIIALPAYFLAANTINIDTANAVAGTMVILGIAMYWADYQVRREELKAAVKAKKVPTSDFKILKDSVINFIKKLFKK